MTKDNLLITDYVETGYQSNNKLIIPRFISKYNKKCSLISRKFSIIYKNKLDILEISEIKFLEDNLHHLNLNFHIYHQNKWVSKKYFSILGPLVHIIPEIAIRNIFYFLYGH